MTLHRSFRFWLVAAGALLALSIAATAQWYPGTPPLGYLLIGNGNTVEPTFQPNPGLLIANNLSDLNNATTARSNLGLGSMATQAANAVAITGGTVTGMANPTNGSDVANKSYVDSTAAGLSVHPAARLASTAALATNVYANGTAGVGATITASGNGALSIDGVAVATNDRVVIKNEGTASHNGIYVVTNTGGASAAFVLTRAADANSAGTQSSTHIGQGTYVLVTAGSTQTNSGWMVNSPVVTIGTDAIVWAQFSSGNTGVQSINGMTGNIGCVGPGLACSSGNITFSIAAPLIVPIRVVTASGAVTVSATTDYFVCINKTTGAATTVNLPATPATGLTFLLKDCKGDAATNSITVTPAAGLIDGAASYVMNVPYMAQSFTYDGTSWRLN